MPIIKRKKHEMPGLNTSSLPDLIFTVLFFFMIVTHMRTDTSTLKFKEPQGTQLTAAGQKRHITHLYVGMPESPETHDEAVMVQLADEVLPVEQLSAALSSQMKDMSEDEREQFVVSMKADAALPMRVINQVKRSLSKAGVQRINYSAVEQNNDKAKEKK